MATVPEKLAKAAGVKGVRVVRGVARGPKTVTLSVADYEVLARAQARAKRKAKREVQRLVRTRTVTSKRMDNVQAYMREMQRLADNLGIDVTIRRRQLPVSALLRHEAGHAIAGLVSGGFSWGALVGKVRTDKGVEILRDGVVLFTYPHSKERRHESERIYAVAGMIAETLSLSSLSSPGERRKRTLSSGDFQCFFTAWRTDDNTRATARASFDRACMKAAILLRRHRAAHEALATAFGETLCVDGRTIRGIVRKAEPRLRVRPRPTKREVDWWRTSGKDHFERTKTLFVAPLAPPAPPAATSGR
jgi:hypothetical protein